MSETNPDEPRLQKQPVSGFSPTPGCLILVCGLLMIAGLIGWSIFTLVNQNREIDQFTTNAPVTITPLGATEAEREALITRLESFQSQVEEKKATELELTANDLNVLLTLKPFSQINTMFKVEKIENGNIHADISFVLNALPPGNVRYLNGKLLCNPDVIKEKGLVLKTEDITVPGKTVAEGFLRRYKQDGRVDTMMVQGFRDEDLKTPTSITLSKITSAEIKGDKVVISYSPEKTQAER